VRYLILVDEFRLDHSGIWPPPEPVETARLEPETIIVALAWVLATLVVLVTVVRGEAFGPDRAVAVAFAVGFPLLARGTLVELVRRVGRRRAR
jgi:hypothetical protein